MGASLKFDPNFNSTQNNGKPKSVRLVDEAELLKLRAINKRLRKEIYETRNLLKASIDLNSALNEEKILRSYLLNLFGMLSTKSVVILSNRTAYEKYYYPIYYQGLREEEIKHLAINKFDGIFERFHNGEQAIAIKPGMQSESYLEALKQIGASVAAPIVHPQKGMLGLVIIGSKHNNTPYTKPEISMLVLLTDFLAVALANSRVFQEMERISLTDPLTGLFNRRYFENYLQKEVSRARRFNHPLSLVMLDIDHFKNINDRLGHPSGDSLLQQMAAVLLKTVRCHDVVARYGGEEFSILLPEVPQEGALSFCERLRNVVNQYPFENREIQPRGYISVSVGAAVYPFDGLQPKELIAHADRALYAAKQNGRNRVAAYQEVKSRAVPEL